MLMFDIPFATTDWGQAPSTLSRYNGVPSFEFQGLHGEDRPLIERPFAVFRTAVRIDESLDGMPARRCRPSPLGR